jgi:hypothetical protein
VWPLITHVRRCNERRPARNEMCAMSRGLGFWQRQIMDALSGCEPLPTRLLLPIQPTRAERNALSRAVMLLEGPLYQAIPESCLS